MRVLTRSRLQVVTTAGLLLALAVAAPQAAARTPKSSGYKQRTVVDKDTGINKTITFWHAKGTNFLTVKTHSPSSSHVLHSRYAWKAGTAPPKKIYKTSWGNRDAWQHRGVSWLLNKKGNVVVQHVKASNKNSPAGSGYWWRHTAGPKGSSTVRSSGSVSKCKMVAPNLEQWVSYNKHLPADKKGSKANPRVELYPRSGERLPGIHTQLNDYLKLVHQGSM